jgi:hypothetical protein
VLLKLEFRVPICTSGVVPTVADTVIIAAGARPTSSVSPANTGKSHRTPIADMAILQFGW